MSRPTRFLAALSLILFSSSLSAKPDIDQRLSALETSNRSDIVKYQMEYALAALQNGEVEPAKRYFDLVLGDIESFFSHNEEALKARSMWYEEGRKTFKGEPYERAMAYYYRGLLHMLEGEADNARASFLSGQLQDAFAEEDQHKTDFALLMLLEAWAAHSMGSPDLAQAPLKDFSQLRSMSVPTPDTHALVIVETGKSPRKLRDGVSGEKLVYRRGKRFKDKYATISAENGGFSLDLVPVEDIFYQATTRGSRWIDSVNEGKAVYKEKVNTRGMTVANLANQLNLVNNIARDYETVLNNSGANDITMHLDVNFGAFSIGASALSMIGTKIKPKSDNRYWDNLPDNVNIGFVPMEIAEAQGKFQLSLHDIKGQPVHNDEIELTAVPGGGSIAWYKFH